MTKSLYPRGNRAERNKREGSRKGKRKKLDLEEFMDIKTVRWGGGCVMKGGVLKGSWTGSEQPKLRQRGVQKIRQDEIKQNISPRRSHLRGGKNSSRKTGPGRASANPFVGDGKLLPFAQRFERGGVRSICYRKGRKKRKETSGKQRGRVTDKRTS